jgi:hypothetical protein
LNLNDRLGLAELGRQLLVLSPQSFVLGDQGGVGGGLPPAAFGSQTGQGSFVSLLPPGDQVRRIQALAAQEDAKLAGLGATVGFLEDAQLVLRGESSTHGLLRHGRVGDRLSVALHRASHPAAPQGRGSGGGRNVE